MSIREIYDEHDPDKAMDITIRNCTMCTKKCNNLDCKNMKALMDAAESMKMTDKQKRRYFEIVGG